MGILLYVIKEEEREVVHQRDGRISSLNPKIGTGLNLAIDDFT
jgi:hypothetical protein